MAGKVADVSEATFEQEVLQSDKPVVVDFWAPWCGPCRMVSPIVEALAEEWAGKVKVVKVNVDDNPGVAGRYRIMSIPTLMVFKDGREAERLIGAMPKEQLKRRLEPHVLTA